jgi:hypothetical protein
MALVSLVREHWVGPYLRLMAGELIAAVVLGTAWVVAIGSMRK